MTISMPYVMVKNIEFEKKLMIDYSKNPCPDELTKLLKCVTNKQITSSIECKKHYKKYISCIKKYNLTPP
jgi:hypothetical protein